MVIGIVCYPTFGGSGVLATELGIELSKKGYEIHFITYNQPVKLELLDNNVHYHEVNVPDYPLFHYPPYELALSSKLVEMVKKYDHVVSDDLYEWLDYVEITENEFWRVADSFRSPRVWSIENGYWVKDCVWGTKQVFGKVHLEQQHWNKYKVS